MRIGVALVYWPDGTPVPHDECPMAIALRQKAAVRGRRRSSTFAESAAAGTNRSMARKALARTRSPAGHIRAA